VSNGTSCSDGNACNGTETCQAGVCTAGTALTCADANPCTTDTCDPVAGCKHTVVPNGTSCSDANVCNGNDTCQNGSCTHGIALNCNDGNPCTVDTCDPIAGCQHGVAPDGTPCPDGNLCNGAETCQSGVCTAGPVLNCNDSNYCTTDLCNPTTGCYHTPVTDGASCSDGNLCNGVEVCHAGVCQPGTPISCADNNPCTTETCDPKAGCLRTPVANGTPCVDSNLCNGEETCQSGVCTPGTPPTCSGSGIDACDPITGCTQDIMIAAHKLGLRMSFTTVRMKLSLLGTIATSDPPSNGTASDPVLHGGSLRLVSGDGVQFANVYTLPASNWKYIGPPGSNLGYRYRDSAFAFGPVKGVVVRNQLTSALVAVWPKAGLSLDQNPSPVGVVLRLGGTRYCMSFGGTTAFVPDVHFGGTDAPAPAACPP